MELNDGLASVTVLRLAHEQRRLLIELVRRDIRGRFAGARFGLLWSVITPAVQLAAYSLIFGYAYGTASRSGSAVTASLFCGLWPWWAFQEGVVRGMGALVEQAGLMRRVPMSATIPVLAATIASVAIQMLGFVIFLAVFAALGVIEPSGHWLLLPLVVALQLALAIGVALVLAPLYLVVRDAMYAVNLLLTIGFFVSPVLYQLDALPAGIRSVALLNPLAVVIGMFRASVLGVALPSALGLVSVVAVTWGVWHVGTVLVSRVEGRIDEYC